MAFFSVNCDLSEIAELLNMKEAAKAAGKDAANKLATAIHGKMLQLAAERMHSTRQIFVDGLSMFEEDGVWVISLDGKVRWTDDGMPKHDGLTDLLASPKAKTGKNGGKYIVVPFNHGPGKGPSQVSAPQADLISTLKKEMKKRDIPWGKIEVDGQGNPKMGRLHSFDILKNPKKTGQGLGMGQGPVGAVRQGRTGVPFLAGVSVSQRGEFDKNGQATIKRSVMTFRTASDSQRGKGTWENPGFDARSVMEEAVQWARDEWNDQIEPAIREALMIKLK